MTLFDDANQYIPTINKLQLDLNRANQHKIFMIDEWQVTGGGGNLVFHGTACSNGALNRLIDNLKVHFSDFKRWVFYKTPNVHLKESQNLTDYIYSV